MEFALITGIAAIAVGIGVGIYVTDFTAYLGNNPATCNNCHVMDAVYEGWFHGSHQEGATCSDCHTHALIPKYITNGISEYLPLRSEISLMPFEHNKTRWSSSRIIVYAVIQTRLIIPLK